MEDANKNVAMECMSMLAIAMLLSGFYALLGMPLVTAGLDKLATPPLSPQGNYGQFGMLAFVVAPSLFLAGLSYGAIPCLNFWSWTVASLPVFGLGAIVGISVLLSEGCNLTDTAMAAFVVGCIAMNALGVIFAGLFKLLKYLGFS